MELGAVNVDNHAGKCKQCVTTISISPTDLAARHACWWVRGEYHNLINNNFSPSRATIYSPYENTCGHRVNHSEGVYTISWVSVSVEVICPYYSYSKQKTSPFQR
ncbi:hypothetical protein Pelo_12544 [Pelomyxa schiedti]|nr:hypothetical protein Pelo_12544 [Pelomyxa schiedti]